MLELRLTSVSLLVAALLVAPWVACAEDPPAPPPSEAERQKRLEEVEAQMKVLSEEIQSLKTKLVLPETREYKSLYGLGPAASKIYQLERGLSIGGYGEASLRLLVAGHDGRNTVDLERFVLYAGYKFTDRIILNSEIEFEHATTEETVSSGSGSVNVEFAYLDFRLWDPVSARTGLVLVPVGFVNEIHEPPFFFGNRRPEVERRIIPATWSELGAGLYGAILPGLEYRSYVVSSLNAKGFSASDIREARQAGNEALAEDVAWTGRIDYTPIPGLLVWASFFWGDTGQDQTFAGQRIDANLFLYDVHAQLEYRGLHLRALFTEGHIGDARVLSAEAGDDGPISRRIWGAYGEVAYDVLPLILPGTRQSLAPFVRLEWLDTQADVPSGFARDRSKALRVTTAGVSYKPIPQIVFKLDYRELSPERGENVEEVNIGFGFAF